MLESYIQKRVEEIKSFTITEIEDQLRNTGIYITETLVVTVTDSEGEDVTEAMLDSATILGTNHRTIRFTIKAGEASINPYRIDIQFLDTDDNKYSLVFSLRVFE